MAGENRHADAVAKATQRLAVLKARQLLRELRAQKRTREAERRRVHQRRMELGHATSMADIDDYSAEEVVGMILDAKERHGHSPTHRLAMRKRGEEWLRRSALQGTEQSVSP